jgi:hypothetical protein
MSCCGQCAASGTSDLNSPTGRHPLELSAGSRPMTKVACNGHARRILICLPKLEICPRLRQLRPVVVAVVDDPKRTAAKVARISQSSPDSLFRIDNWFPAAQAVRNKIHHPLNLSHHIFSGHTSVIRINGTFGSIPDRNALCLMFREARSDQWAGRHGSELSGCGLLHP